MRPGRKITICALVALVLPGCVMGIPDAGPAPPKPPEPCEVVVIDKDAGRFICMSRERLRREQAPVLFPPDL